MAELATDTVAVREARAPSMVAAEPLDPVVAAYLSGVDQTLLIENLKLTHEQRLLKGQSTSEMAVELRRAGRAARSRLTGS